MPPQRPAAPTGPSLERLAAVGRSATDYAAAAPVAPAALAERPHIETITTLCQPLHGDDPTWQSLREVVTAIDSRKAISGRL